MIDSTGLQVATAEKALVSVVLPTRSRVTLLQSALRSVQDQTYSCLEVLVVDDGSTDDTPEFLAAEAKRDPRIQVIRHETGQGAPAARNRAIAMSHGEFIAFQDDDTIWTPDKLQKLVRALRERGPDVGFAYTPIESIELDGPPKRLGVAFSDDKYRGPWGAATFAVVLRKSVVTDVGGFDERLPRLQDFDLWVRVLARTDFVFVSEPMVRTRRVAGGISTDRDALARAAALLSDKYDSELCLPRLDRAQLHCVLGQKLCMDGFRRPGVAHLFRAIQLKPTLVRPWLSLGAALAGPSALRAAMALREKISSSRAGEVVDAPVGSE